MELLYDIHDRPSKGKTLLFALQQLLAILAGTITLPLVVGYGLSQSAALFGAAVGTLVYLTITKFRSPVFLGSSFTYLSPMMAAFASVVTYTGIENNDIGYFGIVLGALLAGLVYVILSIIVKHTGTGWVEKVFPPVIIGPVVMLIGLTLAPGAITNLYKPGIQLGVLSQSESFISKCICILVGLVTLFTVVAVATHAKKFTKFIPFIIGIFAGYAVASLFTVIGIATNTEALKIIDFSLFKNLKWIPDFAFIHAFKGMKAISASEHAWRYVLLIIGSYVPLSFAIFSEHIADHKNLSSIIEHDLTVDPGLSRTAMGDGVGSMVGALFGGCPNTTYGESISCVAFSKNASIITIVVTSVLAIAFSFFAPLMTFFQTIPPCLVGGLSIALYGYIASSGLKMVQKVDMGDVKNIFIISSILVCGIGSLFIDFYHFQLTAVPSALIIGLLVNLVVSLPLKKKAKKVEENKENPEK